MKLHVHTWGQGPPVVLLHGWVLGGRETWRAQRPLTERWTLLAPDLPGHGSSPPGRQDAELYAQLVAEQLLRQPAHLVGYSHGAIVAMLAAREHPGEVRSLTLIEPPATAVAEDDPRVRPWDAELRRLCADPGEDLVDLLQRFFRLAGVPVAVPTPLPPALAQGARAIIGARPPGDVDLPLDALARSPFPALVVSGGHLEVFEVIADTLASGIGARREVVTGAGHLVPDTGEPFNGLLEDFLSGAEGGPR